MQAQNKQMKNPNKQSRRGGRGNTSHRNPFHHRQIISLFFIVNHQYSFAFHSVHICCISLLALSQACSLLFWTQEKSLRITMEQCPYRQLSRTLPSWQMYLKRKVKNKTSLQITYDTSEFLFNFNDQGTFYS